MTRTNDRRVLLSEGAPHKDKTEVVKLYIISGHEPQLWLDTKTDKNDRPSVAMWLWLWQRQSQSRFPQENNIASPLGQRPPAFTMLVTAAAVLKAAPLSLALASRSGLHCQAKEVSEDRPDPSQCLLKLACWGRSSPTFFWGTNRTLFRATKSHWWPHTLLAYSSVYSFNKRTFVLVLCGCLNEYRHPTQ
jgi:hypothetical protein